MIILWKRLKRSIYDKLTFFAPVIIVVVLATILVYVTYLANFTITAAVVAEEGTGTEAASAGLVNALMFILPAIIGGFGIALLFKYRKKLTLRYFFGGALFFAGVFITFFFGDSILYLIQSRFYNFHMLNFDIYNLKLLNSAPLMEFDGIYFLMIVCCIIISFWITFVINSKKFQKKTKNIALLGQSALMGAFLSVILPTFTVVILLIGLSLYDIYSVRRGPIKDIVKYTLEDESKRYNVPNNQDKMNSNKISQMAIHPRFGSIVNTKISNEEIIKTSNNQMTQMNPKLASTEIPQDQKHTIEISSTNNDLNDYNEFDDDYNNEEIDDADSILTNMTYSSRDWDIGIGDLVFYSLLASQPLTPYFIFNHGTHLLDAYGLWIFWVISLFTVIGILIGFVFTIKLLERNSMLPGLPLSIALGLTGFLGSTLIISLI